jgi:hypothetical protein
MPRAVVWLLLLLAPLAARALEIHENFPETINPNERYVIYSHGYIVEGNDPRPEHPEFGIYEFPEIKQTLFAGGGFNLIAHHRPAGTEIASYISMLETWVSALLAAGVPGARITLVGFSRGATLTVFASSRLTGTGINTALMAVCVDGGIKGGPPVSLGGHFLSIYETTDVVGTCETLAAESDKIVSFEEVAISTGRKHGAFFKPLPDWVDPLRHWIGQTNR